MRGSAAISRRMTMVYARGFYTKGRVRSFVKVTPIGTLHTIMVGGRVVAQGDSWSTAYMNMRANLPKTELNATNWNVLDAQVSK